MWKPFTEAHVRALATVDWDGPGPQAARLMVGGTFTHVNNELSAHLASWGCDGAPPPCLADTNGDQAIDVDDLIAVILGWGVCPKPQNCPADVNDSDIVDVDDLVAVILAWGPCS